MNEAETRAELIDPALKAAGWGVVDGSRVRREVITLGRLQGGGKRGKSDIADYVLVYKGHKLAVIEAKKRSLPDTEGLAQAKRYAERLQIRFAYSTNGIGIYQVDRQTGQEAYVSAYPSPEDLWAQTFTEANVWRDRFGEIPFEDKGGFWQPRFYQHNAIQRALEAIAQGRQRLLLTLATGTGKTAIAFQIAWTLFQSRWNLSREPDHRPRILFLADRNILADQAYNSFSAFPEDALVRIDPEIIRKKGQVPKNGSVFFTIFQTFMTGKATQGQALPCFGAYPQDFFDFIVVDECHRGGANDESAWRGILDYFAPAVQLGLTATPKRRFNADTYAYFGEPVYTYSLKDGINDGFLTPFRVRQIVTTLDEYRYTPDDRVLAGQVEEGKCYREDDFNRVIEIREREQYRVKLLLESLPAYEKTLVFCADQDHALAVRDLINQMKSSSYPNYCVRVTANDGPEGERWLRVFQDNEKRIPVILTTSQKLSTGVDARNIRHIVLMRPVQSMIEFKQIIGRGTRLFEGKDYFTIHDFVKAYELFNDPEWDGEPLEPAPCSRCGCRPCRCSGTDPKPCAECGQLPCVCEPKPAEDCPDCGEWPCVCAKKVRLKIQLADGKVRQLQSMSSTSFWGPDGKPLSAAQFVEQLFGQLPALFNNEDELRAIWGQPDTRQQLLQQLEEQGFGTTQLEAMKTLIDAPDSDVYDVLAYVAFAAPAISRSERVKDHHAPIFSRYDYRQHEFIQFVLAQYIKEGVGELATEKLKDLLELKYHTINDAVAELGPPAQIREVFVGFQKYLYRDD